jgi:eukaryotic-like serine/threonine-protein kinase
MAPSPEHWARVRDVFESALPLSVNLRPAHLGATCGDDFQLREEVERLLVSHDQSSRFLGTQAALTTIDTIRMPLEGCRVGPYQVIREIGRGGMGSVYLAERADGAFEQRVAIKFIGGAATEPLLRRFHDERRILASFEHINIARLLDGGTTADGIPYFVMEYVDGVPIHDFCRDHRLTVRARIQLFRQVCAAVQYAHQHLVIHRDIKAGNILVTPDGTPKLLDFGIATTLVDPAVGNGSLTITSARAMTPESASPEQVRGDPITVSADIYGLGVLLYRLLTEQGPYSSAPSNQAALLQAVCDEIPRVPSTIAGRDAKQAIGRDLDLITLKALRKEPERRYSTVLQLSDDLQRYAEGRPVLAAPDSAAYRARKFARRHWRILSVAAVAVVAILVAATTAFWQARVAGRERAMAQQRFEMVRQLADSVVFDLNDTLEGVPGSLQARRVVVSKALTYLDQLAQQVGSDVSLMEHVAAAYVRIGDSQGNPYHPNVGDPKGALDSYTRALELFKRTGMKEPGRNVRLAMATAHEGVGDVHWSIGDFEPALNEYREAQSIAERLASEEPHRVDFELELANSLYKIGQTRLRMGDTLRAAPSVQESVNILDRSLREHPDNIDLVRALARGYGKLGDVASQQGNPRRALDYYRQTVTLLETTATRSPQPESTHRLVLFHLRISESLAGLGRWREAEVEARRALELVRPTIQAEAGDTQAGSDQGYAYLTLGDALAGQLRDAEALEAYRMAVDTYRTTLAANPRYIENRRELGFSLAGIGNLALRRRRGSDALVSYREALKELEPADIRPQATDFLAGVYLHAGDAQRLLDAHAPDVLAWYKKSEAAWEERSTRQPLTPAQQILQREAIDKANGRPSTGAGRH